MRPLHATKNFVNADIWWHLARYCYWLVPCFLIRISPLQVMIIISLLFRVYNFSFIINTRSTKKKNWNRKGSVVYRQWVIGIMHANSENGILFVFLFFFIFVCFCFCFVNFEPLYSDFAINFAFSTEHFFLFFFFFFYGGASGICIYCITHICPNKRCFIFQNNN